LTHIKTLILPPSHIGIKGNEMANEVAISANQNILTILSITYPSTTFYYANTTRIPFHQSSSSNPLKIQLNNGKHLQNTGDVEAMPSLG